MAGSSQPMTCVTEKGEAEGRGAARLTCPQQRPQVGDVSVGFGARGQCLFDLGELISAQLRFPSCTSGATRAVSASAPPGFAPLGDDLMGYVHPPGDLRHDYPLFEDVRRTHPTLLDRRKVTLYPAPIRSRSAYSRLAGGRATHGITTPHHSSRCSISALCLSQSCLAACQAAFVCDEP